MNRIALRRPASAMPMAATLAALGGRDPSKSVPDAKEHVLTSQPSAVESGGLPGRSDGELATESYEAAAVAEATARQAGPTSLPTLQIASCIDLAAGHPQQGCSRGKVLQAQR